MAKKKRVMVDVVKIGSLGGIARAENQSREQLSKIGKSGAAAKWANMTEAERKAHGAMLAAARAKKRAGKKKAQ